MFSCRCIAVFSDIHSNYHAFRACYEDARAQGAGGFIFLGDYVSDLAEPRQTLDLVYEIMAEYPTVCLRGNRERYMLDCEKGAAVFAKGSKTGSLLYTFQRLRPRDLDFFRGLPEHDLIGINGVPIEIAHAVKGDDRFYFESGDDRIQGVFGQMEGACLLTGHSHRQYIQTSQGKTILNPGSIGIPQGGGRWPQYALLEVEDGVVHGRLRQVRYPLEAAIHAQFENGLMEYAKYWAVSILYDVITGQECTMQLLERVSRSGDVRDEALWRRTAAEMGMKFTEKEILDFWAVDCGKRV